MDTYVGLVTCTLYSASLVLLTHCILLRMTSSPPCTYIRRLLCPCNNRSSPTLRIASS
ncbi:hypothetical protein K523DRAFT_93434 [Schizophyllum commune Tattone D]|nr:hypothetical protein K523DRAFT_131590 [Schizophyllum commune Tattone D]KAI5826004.1 hypothetical protein K523DRAFT_93434 [Schizophyllum commune Tattone D]